MVVGQLNKGFFNVIYAKIQPILHMSIFSSYLCEPKITSGARYHFVAMPSVITESSLF